jgi:hypothetical protein
VPHKSSFIIDEGVLNELRLLMLMCTEFAPSPQNVASFGDTSAGGASPAFTVVWNGGGRGRVRMVTEVIDERC